MAAAEDVGVFSGKTGGGIFAHGTITLNELGIRTETHVLFATHTESYSYPTIIAVSADLGLFRGWVRLTMVDGGEAAFNMPKSSAKELETALTRRIMTR